MIIPFYLITKWTLILQGLIAICLFSTAGKLFSTWSFKKREIALLVNKNKNRFRPETFKIFMQAPCGRLVVRLALQDLNMQSEYITLLKLQKPLLERWKENCAPVKTVIYINKEAL